MALSCLQTTLRASSSSRSTTSAVHACRRLLRPNGGVDLDNKHGLPPPCPFFAWRRSYKTTKYGGRFFVTMLPGHGIGPEMMNHVETVFFHGKVPVDFEKVVVATDAEDASSMDYAITSIRRTGVAIKGNVETRSYSPAVEPRNLLLRNKLGLYVNVVHCRNHPGIKTRHPNVDVAIIRQNTEGEYSCLEHEEDFEKKLEEAGDKLVVVDFYATWCGPCKMIEPFLKQQSDILSDVVIFLKVDVDENEEIASEYEISCMPTFLFIKRKEKVDEISGANQEMIKEMLAKHK